MFCLCLDFILFFVFVLFLVEVDSGEAERVGLAVPLGVDILESDCYVDALAYGRNESSEFLRDVDLAVNGLGQSVSLAIRREVVDDHSVKPIALFE